MSLQTDPMTEELLIRNILGEAREKMQEEISGLLGHALLLEDPRIQQISKERFFSEANGKLVLTRAAVNGDLEGEIFIFTPLRDAILLGGTLIMLPPSELETRIKKAEFGEEENDAFGEIANILTGVINTLFEENFPKKLRFIKTALQPVNASKIESGGVEPFPPQKLLQGSFSMKMEGHSLGTLDILFPASLFLPTEDTSEPPPLSTATPQSGLTPKSDAEKTTRLPLVLILAEQGSEIETISEALQKNAFEAACLGFQDDAREFLKNKDVSGVFLVMREVTEQGFAAAIRIQSATGNGLPLIAVGRQWTRNTVLKAVKFGIKDILVAPATTIEVQEKIALHLNPGIT